MTEWSVKGVGDAVTVVSPVGDVYPFVITSVRDLRLKLHHRPEGPCRRTQALSAQQRPALASFDTGAPRPAQDEGV